MRGVRSEEEGGVAVVSGERGRSSRGLQELRRAGEGDLGGETGSGRHRQVTDDGKAVGQMLPQREPRQPDTQRRAQHRLPGEGDLRRGGKGVFPADETTCQAQTEKTEDASEEPKGCSV